MENGAVYSPTTEADPGPGRGERSGLAAYFFPDRLPWHRRILKGLQLLSGAGSGLDTLFLSFLGLSKGIFDIVSGLGCLLSLLAFICEEVVSECGLCGGLYFFEFVSCSAFLLSLLLLIVYCTPVYDRVDTGKVKSSDFYITLGTGCVFLLASIIFVSTHSGTSAEIAAIVFGFLASSVFLLEFLVMLSEKLRENPLRKPENNARAEALTEPLNA